MRFFTVPAFAALALLPAVFGLAQIKPGPIDPIRDPPPPYTCCRYPGWPTTVLNFEYPDWNPDHTSYHGLTWKGWAGYNTYPGRIDGWAPIPSNYTTLAAKAGSDKYELHIAAGSRAFYDVHSLWFNYYEISRSIALATVPIVFQGYYGGSLVKEIAVPVSNQDNRVWVHACFNWTDPKGNTLPIDRLTVLLPDCANRKCEGKFFEVDDVWVNGKVE